MRCPKCQTEIDPKAIAREFASKGGKVKSKKKSIASKINGKKGGRPLKNKTKSDGDVK